MATRLDNSYQAGLKIRDILAAVIPTVVDDPEAAEPNISFPEIDVTYELGIDPDFLAGRTKPLINITIPDINYTDMDIGASYQKAETSLSIQIFVSAEAESNSDASQVAALGCQMLSSIVRKIIMSFEYLDFLPDEIVTSRQITRVTYSDVVDTPTNVKIKVAEMEFSYNTEELPLEGQVYDDLSIIETNLNGILYENEY